MINPRMSTTFKAKDIAQMQRFVSISKHIMSSSWARGYINEKYLNIFKQLFSETLFLLKSVVP